MTAAGFERHESSEEQRAVMKRLATTKEMDKDKVCSHFKGIGRPGAEAGN